MTPFIAVAAALVLLVLLILARPLLTRRDARAEVDQARLNAKLIRDELAALERERADKTVSEAEYTQARDELTRRLLDEASAPPAPAVAPATGRAIRTLIAVAVLLPLSAAGLYAWLGNPAALTTSTQAPAASANHDLEGMVGGLAAKLAANPDNPGGWAMLGRSYTVLGRYPEAAAAYEKIGPTLEQNAEWLAEYADALAMNLGSPAGRPEQLAQKALKLDPDNLLALMLSAYAAGARSDFATAVPLAQRALKLVPPNSEDARFLQGLLEKGGVAPVASTQAPASETAPAAEAPAATASAMAIQVDLSIKPEFKAEAGDRLLFVIARVPGERMPIAVLRRSAAELPGRFTLDDSASLNAARPLSSIAQVEIEARVSASGGPQQASGDLFATTQLAYGKPASTRLQIDQRRP
ncbi:c-type cytochrome biogenesis protein CcmI [Niveibacterium sp. SC-1]|uniref:c-type cytochrome biogenesis protein CcmI n=1 Tax=Niveibacterium sp. SC-1 TaxID=3135646 RepID=UPI0031200909